MRTSYACLLRTWKSKEEEVTQFRSKRSLRKMQEVVQIAGVVHRSVLLISV